MAIPISRTLFGVIPWYSVLIVGGILLAIWLAGREERRLQLPKDTAVDLALVVVPCGIVGARLYYVAMSWELFAQDPISILYIWEGGIAIYGAVLGGALGALVYAHIKKLPFGTLLDIVAPGLLLAQAIGRWGNYFNMEAYGPKINNALFQFFPLGVLIPNAAGNYAWHMATFFYESAWNAMGFVVLWLGRKRERGSGGTILWYFLLYGSGRFIIERLREDSLWLGGVRVSQVLSLILCALAAGALLWRVYRKDKDRLAIAWVGALALIARWDFLGNTYVYDGLLIVGAMACAFLLIQNGASRTRWLCLIAAVLLDAAGIILMATGVPFSPSFPLHLHTLLCSITLPMLVGCMGAW